MRLNCCYGILSLRFGFGDLLVWIICLRVDLCYELYLLAAYWFARLDFGLILLVILFWFDLLLCCVVLVGCCAYVVGNCL